MSVVESSAPLRPRSPFAGVSVAGHHGLPSATGVVVSDVSLRGLWGITGDVTMPNGPVAAWWQSGRGSPGTTPGVWRGADGDLVVTAPDQGILVAHDAAAREIASAPGVYVTEMTGSRAICRVSGPRLTDVLARFVPLDLHDDAFGSDDARATIAGHMPITLWRARGQMSVEIAVYRSYARDLWHMVTTAAAPFGYDVT